MLNTMDIYGEIDRALFIRTFLAFDIKEQKEIIDEELKKYILGKINEVNVCALKDVNDLESMTVTDLLKLLASNIPLEEHYEVFRHFTHYILAVAGSLQGWEITWICEDDESLITLPIIQYNNEDKWDTLTAHMKTDYIGIFDFVYDNFKNNFMVDQAPKRISMKLL